MWEVVHGITVIRLHYIICILAENGRLMELFMCKMLSANHNYMYNV